jgi:N-terminal half of MaoC dehydratase
MLLTSVGNDPEVDDPCTSVQKLREDRQRRRRAFRVPERDSQGMPAGAASGRRVRAFTKGLPVLPGAAATLFACMPIVLASAAPVVADPGAAPVAADGSTADPVADAGPQPPPVDDGRVESTPLVTTKSPDGWTLTVSAKDDETQMPVHQYRVPVEEGMIRLFTRAIGDANPRFAAGDSATPDEIAAVDAPPTFVQVGMQFDETYEYRPVAGQPWMGSGKEPSGDPVRLKDGTLLHANSISSTSKQCIPA